MSTKVKVLFVEKCDAKLVQDILQSGKHLNKECRMVCTSDGLVAIPILNIDQIDCSSEEWSDKVVRRGEYECPYSTKKLGNGRLRLSLDSKMSRVQQSLLNWLKDDQGKIQAQILSLDVKVCPKKLEVIGDDKTLVLPPNAFSLNNTRFRTLAVAADINNLWEHLAIAYNSPRVVRRGTIDPNSPIRESGHQLLWPHRGIPEETGPGAPGWITVTEQGIRQSFDLTRVMFSRGNITEKIRMGKVIKKGENVVDLYSGIGYYTLPALVIGMANHVYACEWNEEAAFALKYNLKANGVDNRATVFVGDCRTIAKEQSLLGICNRVVLGLLPSSEGGWRTGVKSLDRSLGGWMHIHGNCLQAEWEVWTLWVCRCLVKICSEEAFSWSAVCSNVEKVKSFAPNVNHYVVDIFVGPRDQLAHHGIQLELKENQAGLLLPDGQFKPSPEIMDNPSCALGPDGVLNQRWMREII
eukprot:CAMPEP_0178896530 /NCGR_PEP_ID=MMETSP0786-20121207/1229_1 /TAXON_ID=186022 /ORGANISM="Thalassionema frauenfeldii, Strain CCMP 1798" /LENGTH=466 /DNA_ID=CAMNT_0020566953 /DNA_START=94 /DNA_END=1494 /DNA_ORIENTATION=-